MLEDMIINAVVDEVLSNCKDKINSKDSLEKFLLSYPKNRLLGFPLTYGLLEDETRVLSEVYLGRNKSKDFIVKFIMNNYSNFIKSILKITDSVVLEALETNLLSNELEFDLEDEFLNLKMIMFLRDLTLAKANYNKKTKRLNIYMPKEYYEVIKLSLKDENLKKQNKDNNKIFKDVNTILEAYGIITFNNLYSVLKNKMTLKSDEKELYKLLLAKSPIEPSFNLYNHIDGCIVAGVEFSNEDWAISFYDDSYGNYYNFTKKDYKYFEDGTYYTKLPTHKSIHEMLRKWYVGLDKEFFENFDKEIIQDFIYSAQTSKEIAIDNFRNNISLLGLEELEPFQLKELEKLLLQLFKEHPKWKKRGNV